MNIQTMSNTFQSFETYLQTTSSESQSLDQDGRFKSLDPALQQMQLKANFLKKIF